MSRRDGKNNRNFNTKLVFLIVIILIGATVLAVSSIGGKSKRSNAQWTFMVYMAADNDLDYYGYYNIESMKTIGSSSDVNILVLWDKYDDVANLYKINTDELEIVQGFPLNSIEANMGDPDTLKTFVKYSMRHYRASHNILVLWDHGDDFLGCCWDAHPEDHLTHQEITQALSGVHLDIVAFDACLEGMIEVVYEYVWAFSGPQIDYIVGTEGYVPGWGFPYDTILADLTIDPDMNVFEFSKVIVADYVDYYENLRPASRLVELASIDMTYVTSIVQQLGDLTDILEGLLELDNEDTDIYHELIATAKGEGNLGWSQYGWEAYIDLPTFVYSLYESLKIPEAITLYETIKTALYVETTEPLKSAEGLGIYFPGSYGSFQNNVYWHGDEYLTMQFPHEGWWDFLQAYWGI
ncbi:MAG: clostripain-related cysteine peptidase [Candidatus Hodarchaeota archaeon]